MQSEPGITQSLAGVNSGFATPAEAAVFLRLSKAMVHKLIGEGKMPVCRYGARCADPLVVVEGAGWRTGMIPRLLGVWRALGGPEPQGRYVQAWWRQGDGRNVALDLDRGVWYDHARGVGGGVVQLIQVVFGCTRREALYWLRQNYDWPRQNTHTAAERRQYAQRKSRAEHEARRLLLWRLALLANLDRSKTRAFRDFLTHPSPDAERAWENASRRQFFVHRLTGTALVQAYQKALRYDRTDVEQLVAVGRQDEEHANRCTADVVAAIARAVRWEASGAA